jgi:hypothetical protein
MVELEQGLVRGEASACAAHRGFHINEPTGPSFESISVPCWNAKFFFTVKMQK